MISTSNQTDNQMNGLGLEIDLEGKVVLYHATRQSKGMYILTERQIKPSTET